jgi:hypothetical protein
MLPPLPQCVHVCWPGGWRAEQRKRGDRWGESMGEEKGRIVLARLSTYTPHFCTRAAPSSPRVHAG